ncbi:MAG: Ig-like domain-containing protein, partial [Bifidobacteriaceae bacterium]|nr:Ig-like domain-containing protein [Bifidobacteriaceae bacterium]
SGYVTGSVFSDIEPNVLYALTDIGGAYRYDFANDYWIGLNDDATDAGGVIPEGDARGPGRSTTFVTSIVPDPVKKGRVYMTAGQSNANNVLRSDDYGAHWTKYMITGMSMNGNDGSNRSSGPRLAIDPNNNSVLYYAARATGLWKSTDYGATWARVATTAAGPVGYDPTYVTIDPNSPVDPITRESLHVVVATTGVTGAAWTGTAPERHREFASLWETNSGVDTSTVWTEVPGQPAPGTRDYAGFVSLHSDWDQDGNLVVAYAEFGTGVNSYNLEAPTDHAQYVRGGVTATVSVGSNSNFAHDGRVYRFDFGTAAEVDPDFANDITPPNVYTREYPPLAELQQDYPGQKLQRGGFGGISVSQQPEYKGVIVASTFHRHDRMAEEVVQYSPDNGATWRVVHSEVAGQKDFRGYGYIDKDNGWGAAVHWAFDLQMDPFNTNSALFTTGAGFWWARDLTKAQEPVTGTNQPTWGFWDDGLEETVMWNLYSPSQTKDYLYATYADWGSMSWAKDYSISPDNSLVNRESIAARQMYDDPPFDANGDPTYRPDLVPSASDPTQAFDVAGVRVDPDPATAGLGTGWYLKYKTADQPYLERWMNTQNMDYAGLNQNVFVFTPSGNYQNTNCSAGAISFDEGKSATPLAIPAGYTGGGGNVTCANGNAGWISVNADASRVLWTVGGQGAANAYWADISAGPDAAVVGSHQGRTIAESEVRRIERRNPDGTPDYGDRTGWTKINFFNADASAVTSGNFKILSDKVDPNVMYAFQANNASPLFVSTDRGENFVRVPLTGAAVPSVNWATSGHSQGGNKIQIDPFHTQSIYLAPHQAAAGLIKLAFNGTDWISTKLADGDFQQVGIGIGVGTNTIPALYAAGLIADNTPWSAAPAHYGVYRSLDGGATWKRINDDAHQYGDLRAISGDSRVFGRVYLGTGTRGTRVADISWAVNEGTADAGNQVKVVPTSSTVRAGAPVDFAATLYGPFGDEIGDVTADVQFTAAIKGVEIGNSAEFTPLASYTYQVTASYTWTDATGTHTASSAPVDIEVVNVDGLVPVVGGTAGLGATLSATVPAGWAPSFTWFRNGQATGVTGASYAVGAADVGAAITVQASQTKGSVNVVKVSAPVVIPRVAGTASAAVVSASRLPTETTALTVNVTASAGIVPTGQIQVILPSGQLLAATLSGGSASVILPTMPVGDYTLPVAYLGDSRVAPASSQVVANVVAPLVDPFGENVTGAKTAPTVTATLPTAVVTATTAAAIPITVTGPQGVVPTGAVHIALSNGQTIVAALAGGKATVSLPPLPVGTYKLTAVYHGDEKVAAATFDIGTLKVVKATPKVTAKLVKKTVNAGAVAKLKVTVKATGTTPTGTVRVTVGNKVVKKTLTASNKGVVTVNLPKQTAGKYKIKVKFTGNDIVANTKTKSLATLTVK